MSLAQTINGRLRRVPAWPLYPLGLLPFAGAALAALSVAGWQADALIWLRAYGAVILAFLGAVHWGLALAAGESPFNRQRLVGGVVPALAEGASSLPWV